MFHIYERIKQEIHELLNKVWRFFEVENLFFSLLSPQFEFFFFLSSISFYIIITTIASQHTNYIYVSLSLLSHLMVVGKQLKAESLDPNNGEWEVQFVLCPQTVSPFLHISLTFSFSTLSCPNFTVTSY